MKVLGIIPARGGSKGIKNKNVVSIGNRPLIYWTIKNAIKSKLNKIIVSTDSIKIKKIALSYGVDVPFLRPKNISDDSAKTIDVAIHSINFFKKKGIFFDYVMILQPTCPFRTIKDINFSIDFLKKNKKYNSLISLQKVESFHPARMKFIKKKKFIDDNFFKKYFKDNNRQALKKIYIRSGLIYLTKVQQMLNQKTFEIKPSYPYLTDASRSINIDNQMDLKLAKLLKNFLI
jgi:CMP-N,N'-diacetyllegionaminic acid synthase